VQVNTNDETPEEQPKKKQYSILKFLEEQKKSNKCENINQTHTTQHSLTTPALSGPIIIDDSDDEMPDKDSVITPSHTLKEKKT